MLAAENDALLGGKVGGLGDVLRDLPQALAKAGWRVTVIIPSYGFLHKDNPSRLYGRLEFPFEGKTMRGEIWKVNLKKGHKNITQLLFEHPRVRGTPIYFNDPPQHAFAQDATKYALFCSAAGQFLKSIAGPYVIHLHDWHLATLLLLKELHPQFGHLKNISSVFTVHNLAIQGTRPLRGKYATVESWYPELFKKAGWTRTWTDPRYTEPVYNPMAAGIRYSDAVNTVSKTYAREILKPSNHKMGFYGGEGLEKFLKIARKENRLFGILNGIEYPEKRKIPAMSFKSLCNLILREAGKWREKSGDPIYGDVIRRIEKIRGGDPSFILTAVTRVTEQKVRLFFEKDSREKTAIEKILEKISDRDGIFLFLGAGTADYEERLTALFRKNERFIYLKGYSDPISQALYANGTIFMMPSSFEPCGIGQMIAMRDGQPCVVNSVGGLKDTVTDGVNGFRFSGRTITEQVSGLVNVTARAVDTYLDDRRKWERIRKSARGQKFTWESSARQYIDLLYNI